MAREGLARDAVRLVQNARKEAGLEVSDRIALELAASGELLTALREHAGTIAAEVLATQMDVRDLDEAPDATDGPDGPDGPDASGDGARGRRHREEHELGGATLRLTLASRA